MAVQLITAGLCAEVVARARRSPRRRMNYNFHSSLDEGAHRFLNALLRGTYIRPHRHVEPPKAETFLTIEGEAACFLFDETGVPELRCVLGRGGVYGIDIPAGVWHTVAALTEHTVCFEVKPGPYSPATDKEFAPWAPAESDAAAAGYLTGLLASLEEPC